MSEWAGRLKERIRIDGTECWAAIVPAGEGETIQGMALAAMPRFEVMIRSRAGATVGGQVAWGGRRLLIRQRIDDPRRPDRILLRCEEMRG
jgi:hypothetical protein